MTIQGGLPWSKTRCSCHEWPKSRDGVIGGKGRPKQPVMPWQESDDPVVVIKPRPKNPGNGREGKTWTTAVLVRRRPLDPKRPVVRRSGEPAGKWWRIRYTERGIEGQQT